MPIPYMGSKRKSSPKIYQTIKNFNKEASILVDLFCGGFAIGEYFYKKGWKVIANDKNKYVISLLDQTINIGLDEIKCLEFVSRNKFNDVLLNPNKYEDWYVGYVMCIWSFGNNQKGYLFGKDIERFKKAGHEIVVNKNPKLLLKLFSDIPTKYIDGIIKQKDWHTRRIALGKVTKVLKTRIFELQQLERLQRLEQLETYSMSYSGIKIPIGAIVYCDPPYQGTAEYKEGAFNHEEFWQWVRKVSKTNKIYISEYSAPNDFESILSFSQKSTLQGGVQKHNNQPLEKLFIPIGQENGIKTE